MSRIQNQGDWGSCADLLNGEPIKHNEELRVVFPDGSTRIVTAHVVKTHGSVSDHGHDYGTTQQHVHCRASVFGVEALVPLVDLEATRLQPTEKELRDAFMASPLSDDEQRLLDSVVACVHAGRQPSISDLAISQDRAVQVLGLLRSRGMLDGVVVLDS